MNKTTTVYTKENLDTFLKFALNKNKYFIVIYICSAIIILASIFMFIYNDIAYGIIYLLLGLFFASYQLIIMQISKKKLKISIGCRDEFEFLQDKFKVVSYSASNEEISTMIKKYDDIYKTYQNNNFFYIFIDKINAYIIDKSNFKDEKEFEQLINFVTSKVEVSKQQKKAQ